MRNVECGIVWTGVEVLSFELEDGGECGMRNVEFEMWNVELSGLEQGRASGKGEKSGIGEKAGRGGQFDLVCLVHLVSFVQPNKRDKPKKPNKPNKLFTLQPASLQPRGRLSATHSQ